MTPAALRARDYLRVSVDNERSPEEQHGDNERQAAALGWSLVGESYRDIGSASRFARKSRDDFDRLLDDLRTDRFSAEVLMLWESSRGSRKVSEWVELIELCVERGVKIYVTTHSRLYNPANPRDRRSLLEDAVDSEYESGKTSERLQRSHAARAANGRPSGRISFGYKRLHHSETGALLGRVIDNQTAPLVRELFTRFVAGDSLRKIELDWSTRGITNGIGGPFSRQHLRQILRNRVYIAERVHMPGRESRWWMAPEEAKITPGTWEPIIDRQVFFAAQVTLTDPARRTSRPGRAKHMLSMFTVCDTCGGAMAVAGSRGRDVYRCRVNGCAQVYKDELEAFVLKEIIEVYLSDPDVYQGLHDEDGVELQQARAELTELNTHYRQLRASFKARRISIAAFEEAEPETLQEIEAAAERVKQLETPSALRGLIEPGVDVGQRLRGIEDPTILRKIAQFVLTPDRAGQLRIKPSPSRGHHVPIGDRVIVWQD